MLWRVSLRPEIENDMAEAIAWYEERQVGLGERFVDEVFSVWNSLASNPCLSARRHPSKDIRWQYPKSFPYRIIYAPARHEVVIIAVMHAARHETEWKNRRFQ